MAACPFGAHTQTLTQTRLFHPKCVHPPQRTAHPLHGPIGSANATSEEANIGNMGRWKRTKEEGRKRGEPYLLSGY